MKYSIVLGTVFGDEGKGVVVDNLCAWNKADKKNSLVVRFSGGHNAGHTVMDDKTKHVFSSFGSGTLLDCPSFYTEDTCISLTHMHNELRVLNEKGFEPILYVHPLANLTTPFDILVNQQLEEKRGWDNRHGSCGAGIGQTMKRNIQSPHKLYTIDLLNKDLLHQKLNNIRKYYYPDLYDYDCQIASQKFLEYLDKPLPFKLLEDYKELLRSHRIDHVVFEGSQGILLDMDHGLFPNVTYANTTSKNVWKYVIDPDKIARYYVTRCYQTRHGNGWMSNEDNPQIKLINTEEEINVINGWQGEFRKTEMDWSLVASGIAYDRLYTPKNISIWDELVLTCLDQRPDFIIPPFTQKTLKARLWFNSSPKRGNLK